MHAHNVLISTLGIELMNVVSRCKMLWQLSASQLSVLLTSGGWRSGAKIQPDWPDAQCAMAEGPLIGSGSPAHVHQGISSVIHDRKKETRA